MPNSVQMTWPCTLNINRSFESKTKLSFDFLCKPNFILKTDSLTYRFLRIFLKGMFCSSTEANTMVSPRCIWLDYQHPGRCLLNMLAVKWQESKWPYSDWDWFGSPHYFTSVFLAAKLSQKPKQIKCPAECLCSNGQQMHHLCWLVIVTTVD